MTVVLVLLVKITLILLCYETDVERTLGREMGPGQSRVSSVKFTSGSGTAIRCCLISPLMSGLLSRLSVRTEQSNPLVACISGTVLRCRVWQLAKRVLEHTRLIGAPRWMLC